MHVWMAALLSTARLSAAPLVGVSSDTAPQLVIEIESAGWGRGAGGFSTSTESTS